MLIHCTRARKGGTSVDLGKTAEDKRSYHFKPRDPAKPAEDHVCEVTNPQDVKTFLAIPEAYEVHCSELARGNAPTAPAAQPVAHKVPAAPATPAGASKPADTTEDLTQLDKSELQARVQAKTGKQPHHSTSSTKLIEILSAQG